MQVSFTSKNILLTDGLKNFITSRVGKLSKYSSKQLSRVQIILDVDRRKKGKSEDAMVEIVGDIQGKHIIVRENGDSFYKAFFGAVKKMKTRLVKSRKKM